MTARSHCVPTSVNRSRLRLFRSRVLIEETRIPCLAPTDKYGDTIPIFPGRRICHEGIQEIRLGHLICCQSCRTLEAQKGWGHSLRYSLLSPKPVSYTHLDVYKRQAHNWGSYDFGSGPQVADRLNQGPVSYTHLDVYKRQVT